MTNIRSFLEIILQLRKTVTITIIAIFIVGIINAQTINKDELKKCFTQYNKAMANEFYDIALENMQKASNMLPESFCPFFNLAFVYRMQGNYQESINQLNKAIMLLDEDDFQNVGDICDCDVGVCSSYKNAATNIYWGLADNYNKLENYEKAISSFSKIITIDKEKSGWAYNEIAITYFKQAKYAESEQYAKQALSFSEIKKDTNNLIRTYSLLVHIYNKRNDNTKTIEYVKKMAELGDEWAQTAIKENEYATQMKAQGKILINGLWYNENEALKMYFEEYFGLEVIITPPAERIRYFNGSSMSDISTTIFAYKPSDAWRQATAEDYKEMMKIPVIKEILSKHRYWWTWDNPIQINDGYECVNKKGYKTGSEYKYGRFNVDKLSEEYVALGSPRYKYGDCLLPSYVLFIDEALYPTIFIKNK